MTKASLSELLNSSLRLVLDPTGVVGAHVLPSGLQLVAHGPHEVALNTPVEDVKDALAEAHDLIVGVEGGVDGAGAVLDHGVVAA